MEKQRLVLAVTFPATRAEEVLCVQGYYYRTLEVRFWLWVQGYYYKTFRQMWN